MVLSATWDPINKGFLDGCVEVAVVDHECLPSQFEDRSVYLTKARGGSEVGGRRWVLLTTGAAPQGGQREQLPPPTIILEEPCPPNVAQEKDKKSEGNIYICRYHNDFKDTVGLSTIKQT